MCICPLFFSKNPARFLWFYNPQQNNCTYHLTWSLLCYLAGQLDKTPRKAKGQHTGNIRGAHCLSMLLMCVYPVADWMESKIVSALSTAILGCMLRIYSWGTCVTIMNWLFTVTFHSYFTPQGAKITTSTRN